MDSLISSLASLFRFFNPVDIEFPLRPDHYIVSVQFGLLMIVVGLGAVMFSRHRYSGSTSLLMPMIALAGGGLWLFQRSHDPWQSADTVCAIAGILFRIISGLGVVVGLICLIGLRPRRLAQVRLRAGHPVVVIPTLCYAVLAWPSLRWCLWSSSDGIWLALSMVAIWLSFAGVFALIQIMSGPYAEERAQVLVAAGCSLLLLLSYAQPGTFYRFPDLYAASFPAGVFIGAIAAFWRLMPAPAGQRRGQCRYR